MVTIKFYGSSDDLFECEASNGFREEIGCYDSHGIYRLEHAEGQLLVAAYYAPGPKAATWLIGVALADEGVPIPNWPMKFQAEHEYSAALIVEAPDGVEIIPCVPEGDSDD